MANKTDPFLRFIVLINLQKPAFTGGRNMNDMDNCLV